MKLKIKTALLEPCPDHQTPFSRFPLEITANVVLFLDCYSLRSLIEAFTLQLSRHFLLIRDEPLTPRSHSFFKGLNIELILWKDFARLVKKKKGRENLIRLIELTDPDEKVINSEYARISSETRKRCALAGKPAPKEFPVFPSIVTPGSFVFSSRSGSTYMYGLRQNTLVHVCKATHVVAPAQILQKRTLVQDVSGLKKVKGSHESKAVKHLSRSGPEMFEGQMSILAVRNICIEHCPYLEGLHCDHIYDLTLVFGKGQTPVIRRVKLPNVHYFTIVYSDYFPVFDHVDIGSTNRVAKDFKSESSYRTTFSPYTLLELVHMDASTGTYLKGSSLKPCLTTLEEMNTRNLTFTSRFHSIHVVGGHDAILQRLDFTHCKEFYWRQVNAQLEGSTPITTLNIPHLVSFTYETCQPYAVVPNLVTLDETVIQNISITTSSVGLNLNGVLENPRVELHTLHINALGNPSDLIDPSTGVEAERLLVFPSKIIDRFRNLEALCLNGFISIKEDPHLYTWKSGRELIHCRIVSFC